MDQKREVEDREGQQNIQKKLQEGIFHFDEFDFFLKKKQFEVT